MKTICGYCGVGCGLEFKNNKLVGQSSHPSNKGLICAKGISQLSTINLTSRLLNPQNRVDINKDFRTTSWKESISAIAEAIKKTTPKKVAFYLSGQLLTEDYYIANKLGKGFIGTNNVDTNSRTCMSSAVVGYKKTFGIDFVPLSMSDIFDANLLILAGANTAEAHVVFHNQIKKAKKSGLKVVVIDPRFTDTAKIADLYLPIKVGSDIDLYNLIMKRLINEDKIDFEFIKEKTNGFDDLKSNLKELDNSEMFSRTGLTSIEFEKFYQIIAENEKIITAWTMGINQSVQGVDKNLAILTFHLITGTIYKDGCGPLSLTGQPNAMGGREVGGLSSMLAVHLDFDDESIKKVSKFWDTDKISQKKGLSATQMLKEDIDVLIVCHTDPLYQLPDRNAVEESLKHIPLIVDINAYDNSEISKFAHIRLPAAPWGEKEGTQTNLDRTITKQKKLVNSSGECKADWEIFKLIAHELGFEKDFDFATPKDIFDEYKEMTRLSKDGHLNIYECDYGKLDDEPFKWGEQIIKEKVFFTKNKKANIYFVQNQQKSEKTDAQYSLLLITGRTRDQWHSGTKTNYVASLTKHKTNTFVEINSNDADALGIKMSDEVKVSTRRGSLITKAVVSEKIREGVVFMPIGDKNINYLTHDMCDPLSEQPDYNHNATKIEKYKGR